MRGLLLDALAHAAFGGVQAAALAGDLELGLALAGAVELRSHGPVKERPGVDVFDVDPDLVPAGAFGIYDKLVYSHKAHDQLTVLVRPMLAAHGLAGIPFSANHLEYVDGHAHMSFLRPNPACCRLGNCKRLIVEEHRPAGGRVVFVGDGLSDACGAAAADLVFAKGLLARHCGEKGIASVAYLDFADIAAALTGL